MKPIRLIELLAEIRANFVAFFSVLMFVCLGVGLFLGIQWSGQALGDASERAFEAGSMHDIQVQFAYGITEDDLAQIRAIKEVSDVEPGYMSFAILPHENDRYVLKVQSLTDRIDVATATQGVLPSKPGEVALLAFWANDHGIGVGDTIRLAHDTPNGDDADGMALLTCDTFVVTGLVDQPSYLSTVSGSLGVADIGTGTVDCVAFVAASSFDIEEFSDSYPVVYISCDSLRGKNTFSDAYKNELDPIVRKVSSLGATLGSARYKELVDDAQGQVDDAERQISEGERQIADGGQQISDGERQLADGEQQISDAEQQLANGEQQISDAERQLAEGRQQLDAGAQQLADGAQQLAAGEQQLEEGAHELAGGEEMLAGVDEQVSRAEQALAEERAAAEAEKAKGEQQLAEARDELDKARAQYDEGLAEYTKRKAEYDADAETFELVRPSYDMALRSYMTLQEQRDTLRLALDELDMAITAYYETIADAEAGQEEEDAAWAEVEVAYDAYVAEQQRAKEELSVMLDNLREIADAYQVLMPIDSDIPELAELDRSYPDPASVTARLFNEALFSKLDTLDAQKIAVGDRQFRFVEVPEAFEAMAAELEDARDRLAEGKDVLDENQEAYDREKAKYDEAVAKGEAEYAEATETLDEKKQATAPLRAQVEAGRQALAQMRAELAEAECLYAQKKAELEEAQRTYNNKLAEFEDAKRKLEENRLGLEDAKKALEDKRGELEDAKKTLADARRDLEDAKSKLEDAREKLKEMEACEWVVSSRFENGGVMNVSEIISMVGNVRWAMALLFVLVGLFVCYSAVSRLVNDEVVQIGTKKSGGFRESEIALEYFWFSGLAVALGTLVAGVVAVPVVEGIIIPAEANSFTLSTIKPCFNLGQLLVGGGIELVLILLSAWLAIHNLLKQNAVDLLRGMRQARATEHFYERTKLWDRMSLYAQTIVNNCVNDTRRLTATIIGVAGCTALIVTAVTLESNVLSSFKHQYERIYGFDSIVYLDKDSQEAAAHVSDALLAMGVKSAPVHIDRVQVRRPDGYRNVATIIVPGDIASFKEVYHLLPRSGPEANVGGMGVWVSQTYADHMGLVAGDEMSVTDSYGKTHTFKIAGVFTFYNLRYELVMSPEQYLAEFGSAFTNNALLAQVGQADRGEVRETLLKTEGYSAFEDDYDKSSYGFQQLESLLRTVVFVYLLLSALMALVVLLNLDIMFVDEKKYELIVLMINGFSARDTQAYIYHDSIVLTVLGIALGVGLGSVMGNVTVRALEPSIGSFIKSFNVLAAACGVVGAGVLSVAVLMFSLQRIPRFKLTDINRY